MVESQGRRKSSGVELDRVKAKPRVRSEATAELKKLLVTASDSKSIAHIAQAGLAAEAAFDRAIVMIEEATRPPAPPPPPPKPAARPPTSGGEPHPPKAEPPQAPPPPKFKPRQAVEVKKLGAGRLVETPEDMDAFLNLLRAELEAVLKANKRAQIK